MDLDLFGAFESGETIDEVAPAENVPSKKRAAAENEAAPATAKLKPSTDSSAEGDNGGDTGAPGVTGAAAAVEPVPRAASGVTHTQVGQTTRAWIRLLLNDLNGPIYLWLAFRIKEQKKSRYLQQLGVLCVVYMK